MFNNYFFVFEIKSFAEKTVFDESVMKYIKNFIRFRLKLVKYFETFDIEDKTYVVIGTAYVEKSLKTKIFFLELYAFLKDSKFLPECNIKTKTINNIELKIFKLSKIKWLK